VIHKWNISVPSDSWMIQNRFSYFSRFVQLKHAIICKNYVHTYNSLHYNTMSDMQGNKINYNWNHILTHSCLNFVNTTTIGKTKYIIKNKVRHFGFKKKGGGDILIISPQSGIVKFMYIYGCMETILQLHVL
jgi:hypothetical protein